MIPLYADLATHKKGDKIPISISNLSNEEYLYLPKDFVVGFAEKDTREGETFEIACNEDDIEIDEAPFKNWIPQSQQDKAGRSSHTEDQIQNSPNDLHKVFTISNFIKSAAEVDKHCRVELKDQNISEDTRKRFQELILEYDDIISKNSGDIGKTLLVEMDIDTGDSPPIAQRPYCLPLQHAEWVKKEINTLE